MFIYVLRLLHSLGATEIVNDCASVQRQATTELTVSYFPFPFTNKSNISSNHCDNFNDLHP